MCDRRDGSLPLRGISRPHRWWSTTRWKTAPNTSTNTQVRNHTQKKTHFLLVRLLFNPRLVDWSIDRSICEPYQNSCSHGGDGVPSLPPVHAALAVSASDPVQKSWHDCGESAWGVKLQAVIWKYDTLRRRTNSCVVVSQGFGFDLPPWPKLPIISSDFNSSRPFFKRWRFACFRAEQKCVEGLFCSFALELANISLKVSVCDEGESAE